MTINTIGRITKDLELKTSEKSGCVYAPFKLVVNEGFGDNQKTTFFDCIVFGAEAERLIKAKAKKGSQIQVTGKFGTSEYPRPNGDTSYSLKITVLAWSCVTGTSGNGKKDANSANDSNSADSDNTQAANNSTEPPHQE